MGCVWLRTWRDSPDEYRTNLLSLVQQTAPTNPIEAAKLMMLYNIRETLESTRTVVVLLTCIAVLVAVLGVFHL